MTVYKVALQNDMGHLDIIGYEKLPQHIREFAYSKMSLYVEPYLEKHGKYTLQFFRLKPNLKKQWTYYCGSDVVNIDFSHV